LYVKRHPKRRKAAMRIPLHIAVEMMLLILIILLLI
jgi:hypothetical protein